MWILIVIRSTKCQDNVINFGLTTSSTGIYSSVTATTLATLNFFINWANVKQEGIKINGTTYTFAYKSYDDSSIDNNIPVFYEALTKLDHVNFLISPISPTAEIQVQQIAADNQILLIDCTVPYIPYIGYNTTYTISYEVRGDRILSSCLALLETHPVKTALIIGNEESLPYVCLQLADLPRNITILGTEEYSSATLDFTALVAKWKLLNPDVLIGGGLSDSSLISKAIRLANWNPIIIAIVSQATITPAMNYVFSYTVWNQGVPYTDPYFGTPTQLVNDFNSFTNKSGVGISVQALAAYLSVYLAINNTQSLDSTVVRDAILQSNFSTLYGQLTFDSTNSIASPPICIQNINGTSILVAPSEIRQQNPVFGKIPILPADCYPPIKHSTQFLLSVTLGTILPGLCLLSSAVVLSILAVRKFDLILLPKQNVNNIDF